MSNSGKKLTGFFKQHAELIVSMTAMITAIAAVAVAIVQTQVMKQESESERAHQRLSVMPSVWLSRRLHDDGKDFTYHIAISNLGLGPAIIEEIKVDYKGQPVADWNELLSVISLDLYGEDRMNGRVFPSLTYNVRTGQVLPEGEAVKPIEVNSDNEVVRLFLKGHDGMHIAVCYCSLYGECWRTEGLDQRPKPTMACESDPNNFNTSNLR